MKQEESLLKKPLGQMVEVDGHMMCVYEEGEGAHTLLFLSGSERLRQYLISRAFILFLKMTTISSL
jgi:hypothetical protein